MIGRYTAKVARDGGLAAVMLAMGISNSLDNPVVMTACIIAGVGAALCALSRVPLVLSELNGFRRLTA